jgi:hypothetical protein
MNKRRYHVTRSIFMQEPVTKVTTSLTRVRMEKDAPTSNTRRLIQRSLPDYYHLDRKPCIERGERRFEVPTRTRGVGLSIRYDPLRRIEHDPLRPSKSSCTAPLPDEGTVHAYGAIIRAYLFPARMEPALNTFKRGLEEIENPLPRLPQIAGHPHDAGEEARTYGIILQAMLHGTDIRTEAGRYHHNTGVDCNTCGLNSLDLALRAYIYNPTPQRVDEAAREFRKLTRFVTQNKDALAEAAQMTIRAIEMEDTARGAAEHSDRTRERLRAGAHMLYDYAERTMASIGRPEKTIDDYVTRAA